MLHPKILRKILVAETGCWMLRGMVDKDGYTQLWWQGKVHRAHRLVWSMLRGPIPNGLVVRHQCGNSKCVNPEHLLLGTQKENMQDKVRMGRHPGANQTHCKEGHEFTEENTYIYPTGGNRACKICRARRSKEQYAKSKNKPEGATAMSDGSGGTASAEQSLPEGLVNKASRISGTSE